MKNCSRRDNAALCQRVAEQQSRIAELEARLTELERRVARNPRNSSMPPTPLGILPSSSDGAQPICCWASRWWILRWSLDWQRGWSHAAGRASGEVPPCGWQAAAG